MLHHGAMWKLCSLALLALSITTRSSADEEVTVLVVDHAGAPVAGVKVSGVDLGEDGEPTRRIAFVRHGKTDADGAARLRRWSRHDVYAAALFDGRPVLSSPDAPLRIVLPPTGSLEVDLGAYPDASGFRFMDAGGERWIRERVDRGATIPHVPLGIELRVEIGGLQGSVSEVIDGPSAAGEVVRWRPEPPGSMVVRAQLVDADGDPLDGMSVRLWKRSNFIVLTPIDGESGWVEGRVRADRWDLSPGERGILRELDGDRLDAGLLEGTARAPKLIAGGVVDLGQVTLAPHPLAMAGRVVGADGAPVEGARIRIQFLAQVPDEARAERDPPSTRLGAEWGLSGALEDGRAGAAFASVDFTDGEGRFELRTSRPIDANDAALLFFEATGPGRRGSTARGRVEVGRRDLEIGLVPNGTVRVDLGTVPAPVRRYMGVRARRVDGMRVIGDEEQRNRHTPVGSLSRLSLPPGDYDLDITFGAYFRWLTDVATIEGVHVPEGGEASDTRLEAPPIPLRSATLHPPAGDSLAGRRVAIFPGKDPGMFGMPAAVDVDAGVVTWLELEGQEHVFIDVGEYGPVDVCAAPEGGAITLAAPRPVRILFEGDSPPDPGTYDVAIAREGWPAYARHPGVERCASGDHCWRLVPGQPHWIRMHGPDPSVREPGEQPRDSDPTPEQYRWHGRVFRAPLEGGEVSLGGS